MAVSANGVRRMSTRKLLTLSLALAALGVLVVAQAASATHPRPKGATPLRVPLVPAYKPCTAPNRSHGAPLSFPSCGPPVQSSDYLTVGTADANGAATNSVGSMRLDVQAGVVGPPDDADVLIKANITDVRCKPATAATVCGTANAAGGPDYSGELQFNAVARISDHYNANSCAPSSCSFTDPATTVDIPSLFVGFICDELACYLSPPVTCFAAATASTTVGGTCNLNTSANALNPGQVKEFQREVTQFDQFQVYDGGADGRVDTQDNTLFEVQGVFVP